MGVTHGTCWPSPTLCCRPACPGRGDSTGAGDGQPPPLLLGGIYRGVPGPVLPPQPLGRCCRTRSSPVPPRGWGCTSPSCILLPQHDGPRPSGFQFRSQAPCRTGGFVGTKRRLPPPQIIAPLPPGRHHGIPQPAAGRESSGPFLVGTFPRRTGGIIACKKNGEREGRERICYTALP